jgi:hypothetical protein
MTYREAKRIAKERGWAFVRVCAGDILELQQGGETLAWDSRYPDETWNDVAVVLVRHVLAREARYPLSVVSSAQNCGNGGSDGLPGEP